MAISVGNTPRRTSDALSTKLIDVASALGQAILSFAARLERVARTYDGSASADRRVSALKAGAQVLFNAIDLSTVNQFLVAPSGGKPARIDAHKLTARVAEAFSISRAVAASSVSLPAYQSLKQEVDGWPHTAAIDYLKLTEGGSHDNMGATPALSTKRNLLEHLITSDRGQPVSKRSQPTESRAVGLKSSLDITTEQSHCPDFDHIQRGQPATSSPKLLWLSIDSRASELVAGATVATPDDTGLTSLQPEQFSISDREGSTLAATQLAGFARDLLTASTPPTSPDRRPTP